MIPFACHPIRNGPFAPPVPPSMPARRYLHARTAASARPGLVQNPLRPIQSPQTLPRARPGNAVVPTGASLTTRKPASPRH